MCVSSPLPLLMLYPLASVTSASETLCVFAAGMWGGMVASSGAVTAMTDLWHEHQPTIHSICHRDSAHSPAAPSPHDPVIGCIPAGAYQTGTPVKTSTGLGLPLCRSFAVAAGGWACIEDCADLAVELQRTVSSQSKGSPKLSSSHVAGMTQFWAMMRLDSVEHIEPQPEENAECATMAQADEVVLNIDTHAFAPE